MVRLLSDRRELLDAASLYRSVERMHTEHIISAGEEREIAGQIKSDLEGAGYILKHLGGHLAIGGFRYLTMIPLPIGSMVRPLWVVAWRVIESLRGNKARAAVHSLPVFLFSVLPFLGYSAYMIALRRSNERFAFVLANHLCYHRKNMSALAFYEGRSAIGRRLMRVIVPPASAALGRETPA
ncbi:MAG: hypothetical protein HRT77_00430 [Halioglobus sp.]|nr:hypothetical protein [Halioglobus sp.]